MSAFYKATAALAIAAFVTLLLTIAFRGLAYAGPYCACFFFTAGHQLHVHFQKPKALRTQWLFLALRQWRFITPRYL
jgi:hypothetical protein